MPQPFHHGRERRLLLIVRADPAQPHADRDEVATHAGLGLRPDPPCRPIIAAMALRISRGQRRLADAAKSIQRRNGKAAGFAPKRRLDGSERIVPPHEMDRHLQRDVRDGEGLAGEGNPLGSLALLQKFAETDTRRPFVHTKQFAPPDMVRERR